MEARYRCIQRADGSVYYDGPPLGLAEAQMLISEAISRQELHVGNSLRLERDCLVIEDCGDTA
jgi:sorbitol-specific phosphotransferase system component IIA